jgi:hypothetical protein
MGRGRSISRFRIIDRHCANHAGTLELVKLNSNSPHAKDAKVAKEFSRPINLCDLCDLCVRQCILKKKAASRSDAAFLVKTLV